MPLKNLLPITRIMEDPLPLLDWLVEGWITQGERVILYGEFGAGKSYISHALALALASGTPWMGAYRVKKSRVLFLDEEMSEQETRRRLKRLGLGIPLLPGVQYPLTIASHSFDGAGLDTARAMMLRSHLKDQDADVVFIDSMRGVMLGDENKAQDVSAFWRTLEPVWDRGRRSIIVLHHMNKPPSDGFREDRYRASGSTAILSGADSGIAVGKVEVPRGLPRTATMSQVKSRSETEHLPVIVSWPEVFNESPQRLTVTETAKGGPDPRVWGASGAPSSTVCPP